MTPEEAAADPAGYAESLVRIRQALNRFEHVAGMVASGNRNQFEQAKKEAANTLFHARVLVAWCERTAFEPIPGNPNG